MISPPSEVLDIQTKKIQKEFNKFRSLYYRRIPNNLQVISVEFYM